MRCRGCGADHDPMLTCARAARIAAAAANRDAQPTAHVAQHVAQAAPASGHVAQDKGNAARCRRYRALNADRYRQANRERMRAARSAA